MRVDDDAIEIVKDNVKEVDDPPVSAEVVFAYPDLSPQLDITYATEAFVVSPKNEVIRDAKDILEDLADDDTFDEIKAFCIERHVPFTDALGGQSMGKASRLCISRDVLSRTDFMAMDRDRFWQFAQTQRYPEDGINLWAHPSIAGG